MVPGNIAMNSNGGGGLPANCKVSGTGIDLSLRPSQAVGVRGTLKCNGMPASGVLVKLYDHDSRFLQVDWQFPIKNLKKDA